MKGMKIFKQSLEAIFKDCRNNPGIPNLQEIHRKANQCGSYSSAYSDFLHEIRTRLSYRFLSLDDGLKHTIEGIKAQVTQVLVEKCFLGGLTRERGFNFLKSVANQIPSNLSSLKEGFQVISDFQISYRGLVQHRIRKHLDGLTPNLAVHIPINFSIRMFSIH